MLPFGERGGVEPSRGEAAACGAGDRGEVRAGPLDHFGWPGRSCTLRMVALSALVYARTGSPLLAAVAFGIGFLPQVLGGALLGSLADRLRPRPLVAGVYALEAGAAAALALLDPPIAVCLLLVAVVACVTPVMSGAVYRLAAEVLPGDGYVLGRSLMMVAASVAQLLGLAFGGVAVVALGARQALLVACAVYAVAALLVRVLLEDLPPAPPSGGAGGGAAGSFVGASWAVNRRLLADRTVRVVLLAQWLPVSFVAGAESLLFPYAQVRGFAEGAGAFLLACLPVGMMAGNLVGGRLLGPGTRERLVVPLMVLFGLPLAAAVPLPVAAVLLGVTGASLAYELGLQRRFVDVVAAGARGQAFGLLSTGTMTLQGVGPVVFGGVAEVAGVGAAIASAGAATLVVALSLRRGLSRPSAAPVADADAGSAPRPAA
ncbi:MFS transporter [Actinomadura vinacea]|uniref:MFS transporter n=1 Tax=Actinomadura vinacea TaxID=115336 RepID=UPI0031DEA1A6